jgi:osomolarity two-component system response regulator SKN7
MHQLITYFINFENTKITSPTTSQSQSTPLQQPQRPTSPPMLFSAHPNGTSSFLPRSETNRLINLNGDTTEEDVARASFEQMNEMSLRAREAGFTFQMNGHTGAPANGSNLHPPVKQESVENPAPVSHTGQETIDARRSALDNIHREFKRIRTPLQQLPETTMGQLVRPQPGGFENYSPTQVNGNKPDSPHQGLQVFTVGHIMPRGSLEASGLANGSNVTSWQFDGTSLQQMPGESSSTTNGNQPQQSYPSPPFRSSPETPSVTVPSSEPVASTSTAGTRSALRVRRSTFVPAWSVPPRVLLVEDDAVSRRLSSKFLQVFGCTIDVAVDGDSAVNKMNLEKYDLVLMVSAVSPRTELSLIPFLGYCHAEIGWCLCNFFNPQV